MKKTDIEAVTCFIKTHPQVSAKALAYEFGYSHFHFSRQFKKHMGVSLREYLSANKLIAGTKTLVNSQSVTHAQLDAGYENLGAFSNNFKKFAGYSPKKHVGLTLKYIQNLHRLSKQVFDDALLYKIYDAPCYKQAHPLHITVNQRKSQDSLLFIALFHQALPKQAPVFGVCLKKHHTYTIGNIPNGSYYLMVLEVLLHQNPAYYLNIDHFRRDVIYSPFIFPLTKETHVDLNLRDTTVFDPPVALHPLKLLFDVVIPPDVI